MLLDRNDFSGDWLIDCCVLYLKHAKTNPLALFRGLGYARHAKTEFPVEISVPLRASDDMRRR